MKSLFPFLFFFMLSAAMTGCSSEKRPFEARYTSANEVLITYRGQQYRLNRFTPAANLPFQYAFENDGDLDITIDGREYEIDSPYDRDRKKTKKSTKKRFGSKKRKR